MRCKQMLSLSVVTVLLAASLAGCGTSSTAPSAVSSEAPSSAASSAASEVTETAALPDGVYTAEFVPTAACSMPTRPATAKAP